MQIEISIVIPVKNGEQWLFRTLTSIFKQSVIGKTEVIIIDSGSSDSSLQIISQFPVRLISIPPSEFNHGLTRNLGAEIARGKFVVMTVQDAEPSDQLWLEHLLRGFDDDNVAGVCGQQIVPHDIEKNPIDWFRPVSQPGILKYKFTEQEFDIFSAEEKKRICSWDDVTAMYRRDVLLKVPFRPVSFAEDALWARDVLKAGYAIVYNTYAKVNHYHHQVPEYTFLRSFTVFYHFYKFFGLKPKLKDNEVLTIIRNAKLLLMEPKINWADKLKWLVFNYRMRLSIKRAVNLFNQMLELGEEKLDNKHFEICGIPPQSKSLA